MAATNSKLNKLLSRMADMEHQEIEKEFIGLFYGSHGVGKTTTAQALAQKLRGNGKILFLDSADGWVSLDNMPSLKKNTTYLSVPDPRELMTLANALSTRAKGFEEFTVVVLDEVSSWFTDLLHMYVREVTNTSPDEDLPEIEGSMYAGPQQAFLNLVKTFHKVPGLHVIMVAHEQGRALKGEKNAEKMAPSISPKLTNGLSQISHIIGRFEAKKDPNAKGGYRREVQVQPTRYIEAKTRIGGLDVKVDAVELVKAVGEWTRGGKMAADLSKPEQQGLADEPDDDEPEDEDFEIPDEGSEEDE